MLLFLVLISFALGTCLMFVMMRPRITRAESNAAIERARVIESDASRQKVEIDHAGLRAELNNATQLKTEAAGLTAQVIALASENAALKATIEQRDLALGQEREQLNQLTKHFKAEFALLSANALKDNNATFLATAKQELALQSKAADGNLEQRKVEIEQLVKPLQEGIKAYDQAVRAMEQTRANAFGKLETQLQQSVLGAAEVARQASALKDALKKPNVRGRWGEVQLKNCMDLAGMEEHCDVTFQDTSVSSDQDRIRPDMIVRMPGGGKVAVDSKTPMEAFLQYIEASTDEERATALKRHAAAVKARVSELATVNYMEKIANSPDFVVLFLPNESFLAMALEREPTLTEEALNKKVLIATPGTLIGLLKVIRYGWTEHRQTDSAKQIVDVGRHLNTEITKFLIDFAELGEALQKASDVYGSSVRRVEKQITSRSQKLTLLGAKSRKTLSARETKLLHSTGSIDEDYGEPVALEAGDVANGSLQLVAEAKEQNLEGHFPISHDKTV